MYPVVIEKFVVDNDDPSWEHEDNMSNDEVNTASSDYVYDEPAINMISVTTTQTHGMKNNVTATQEEFEWISKHWATYNKEYVTDVDWRRLYPGFPDF